MSSAAHAVLAWRATAPSRVLAAALVVLASAWLALAREVHSGVASVEPEISPLPAGVGGCRPRGKEALEHARALEQVAAARWERVPFALHEAPRAVAQIAEAEACFAAANDRTGRTRAAATRRSYAAELERRFARARLLLRAALREDDATKRASRAAALRSNEPAAVARQQLAILLALLERAAPGARAYRDELEQLARHYAAESPRGSAKTAEPSVHAEHSRGRAPHLPSILKPESTP